MKSSKEITVKRADNIDVLKAICAFLIVCIHVPFPGTVGEYIIALTRIAVPIFFIITGYFYSSVIERQGHIIQIKKIFLLYLMANVFYILWTEFKSFLSHDMDSFLNTFSAHKIIDFLIFNESPWEGHLWYLGAILYVLIIVAFIDKMKYTRLLYYLIPILLLCDLVFGKYSLVILGREFPVYYIRNFLFVGLPYFYIGRFIDEGFGKNITKKTLGILIVLFAITSFLERYVLVSIDRNATRDHYISTTFLAVAVFLFTLKCGGHQGMLSIIGRKYSTWLYILHPIFISCIAVAMNIIGISDYYRYVAPFVVYAATVIFLVVIVWVKNRIANGWLKKDKMNQNKTLEKRN